MTESDLCYCNHPHRWHNAQGCRANIRVAGEVKIYKPLYSLMKIIKRSEFEDRECKCVVFVRRPWYRAVVRQ